MAIVYRIYSNDGAGGPIDYSTPIATTSDLSYTTARLADSGRYVFGVHAYDTSSGVEELNTSARVGITIDAAGNDIGDPPMPPYALVAKPAANGGCCVKWSYPSRGPGPLPTTFLVYLTAAGAVDFGTPAASVTYGSIVATYRCQLSGLADGTTYALAVVSKSSSGRLSAPAITTVEGDSTPPADVDSLTAVAIP